MGQKPVAFGSREPDPIEFSSIWAHNFGGRPYYDSDLFRQVLTQTVELPSIIRPRIPRLSAYMGHLLSGRTPPLNDIQQN